MTAANDEKPDIRMHIVATGWNCYEYVSMCLDSIALASSRLSHRPLITLVNDGSTDSTGSNIEMHPLSDHATLLTNQSQMGAAYSRHTAIVRDNCAESVVVLVDLDDWLLPDSLSVVESIYRDSPETLATFGNWLDESGRRNPQGFYAPDDIDAGRHRRIRPFNGTHLRTFRRRLYNQVDVDDLKDSKGNWLRICTDAAVVFPVLDQCYGSQVRWVDAPIYVYRRKLSQGTLKIYGPEAKKAALEYLSAKAPKSRLG